MYYRIILENGKMEKAEKQQISKMFFASGKSSDDHKSIISAVPFILESGRGGIGGGSSTQPITQFPPLFY